MEKVKVKSMVMHKVSVSSADLRFSRTWSGYGAVVSIDREVLDELIYDVGFRNMLTSGILYIEDMQVKKDLGLEPETATEPQNIIVLTEKDKRYYMSSDLSLVGFKEKIKKLSMEQIYELCNYAINNKLLDVEKAKVLKEVCGRDIIAAVNLTAKNEEE